MTRIDDEWAIDLDHLVVIIRVMGHGLGSSSCDHHDSAIDLDHVVVIMMTELLTWII